MKKPKYLLYALAILVGASLFLVNAENVKALELGDMLTKVNNANIPEGEKPKEGTGGSGIGVPSNPTNEGTPEDGIGTDLIIPKETPNEKEEDKEKEKPKEDKPKEKPTPKKEEKPKSKIPNTGIESKILTYTLITIIGGALFILTRVFTKKNANN